MPRKKKRIISATTASAVRENVPQMPLVQLSLFTDDIKREMPISIPDDVLTETDRLFRIIYESSRRGYCFTEQSSGIPIIRYEDIECKQDGLFVIRFRCEPSRIHKVFFWDMADEVCKAMNSIPKFFHETKYEYGIPYEDCVWVIQSNQAEMPKSKPTEEEEPDDLDARFEEALENFV